MADPQFPKKLLIQPGASTTLVAPGHGIGGYVWTAEVESGQGRIEEGLPEVASDRIGAGSTASFHLTWLGPGKGRVKLSLKRPWESEPIEVHDIDVESS